MFLRRVTVTGFKSFASKTVLNLEPGITGVVGPNGSGKSNLADAVRWALGEQNKTRLRLGDREEVVFAGTAARAKASYAEVVLLFDNEDGAFPLALTEVEISRRLYRSGETDYRLAGRSVRLSDIQALLAQAGFGTNTYAVIGQGMIDSFLLSSPAERKLLFDEAAGIRGPELGREAAQRKLTATSTNLVRLRDIAAELAPRLASLQHAVSQAGQQRALEAQVAELRIALASATLAHWEAETENLGEAIKHATAEAHQLRHENRLLQRRLANEAAREDRLRGQREDIQSELGKLEQTRDKLSLQLADQRSALAAANQADSEVARLMRQQTAVSATLDKAKERSAELKTELASNSAAATRASKVVERAGQEVAEAQAALVAIRQGVGEGTRDQYVDHALQILKTLAINLNGDEDLSVEEVRLLVHKAGRLLSHATHTGAGQLLDVLKAAQKQLEAAMTKRETAVEHQTNVTITAHSLEIDLSYQNEALKRAREEEDKHQKQLAIAQKAAAQLPLFQETAAKTNQALAEVSHQLERQRRESGSLASASANSRHVAELTATFERNAAAANALDSRLTQCRQELVRAKANVTSSRQQAGSLGVTHAMPVPAESVQVLEMKLLRAETTYEAKAGTYRDQSAEYEEVDTRHHELIAQIADLESAQADLQSVISQLGAVIQERFKENFQALSEQFSHYFTRLFDGGRASLQLEEAADGTYGILIQASPKGKRVTNLASLSGGERALAGVALLAAILRVNPGPFVVLDEIDAALDEANSSRLADILLELQEHSQLIVITHNRQTMKAAKVLFGVTSSERHASHIISMRLETATALAAR